MPPYSQADIPFKSGDEHERAMAPSPWVYPPRRACFPYSLTDLRSLATAVPAAHSAATATGVCTGVFVSRAVYAHPQVRRRSERPPRSGSTLVPPPHARARAPEPPHPHARPGTSCPLAALRSAPPCAPSASCAHRLASAPFCPLAALRALTPLCSLRALPLSALSYTPPA